MRHHHMPAHRSAHRPGRSPVCCLLSYAASRLNSFFVIADEPATQGASAMNAAEIKAVQPSQEVSVQSLIERVATTAAYHLIGDR